MGDVLPIRPQVNVWRFCCPVCGTTMTFSREAPAPTVGHCGQTLKPESDGSVVAPPPSGNEPCSSDQFDGEVS